MDMETTTTTTYVGRETHDAVDVDGKFIYSVTSLSRPLVDRNVLRILVYDYAGCLVREITTVFACEAAWFEVASACFDSGRGWLFVLVESEDDRILVIDSRDGRLLHVIANHLNCRFWQFPDTVMWYDTDKDILVAHDRGEDTFSRNHEILFIDVFRYRDGRFVYDGSLNLSSPSTKPMPVPRLYPGYRFSYHEKELVEVVVCPKRKRRPEYVKYKYVYKLSITNESFASKATRHRTAFICCLLFADHGASRD